MGAIVAIVGEAGDPELPERLERMLARSPYRGTPQRHLEHGLALGIQTRGWDASLATVGNWTVAMHGVIGNWDELAPAHGWNFPHDATSATKLAIAYEDLGDDLFGRLRGEFAIVVYDRAKRRLIAGRDLWGRRPLFLCRYAARTYLATEIRQITIGSGIPVDIDGDAIVRFLTLDSSSPDETHLRGIARVNAGKVLEIDAENPDDVREGCCWWNPSCGSQVEYDLPTLVDELRSLVRQSVRRWLVGTPIAVSLSGGVDSSTIWSTVIELQRAGSVPNRAPVYFSLVYPGRSYDEGPQIDRILEATGGTGFRFDLSTYNGVENMVEKAARIDQPFHGIFTTPPDSLSRLHKSGSNLVLDGVGGDVVLGGSPGYLSDLLHRHQYFQILRDVLTMDTLPGESRLAFVIRRVLRPLWARFRFRSRHDSGPTHPAWIHASRRAALDERNTRSSPAGARDVGARHQAKILDDISWFNGYAGQEGAEQYWESAGLTTGSPFLDIDIVDFAMRAPPRAFSHGIRYKHLLRQIAYDRFPSPIPEWSTTQAPFHLSPSELELLNLDFPCSSWSLVDLEVVDGSALKKLFGEAGHDREASSELGILAAAEAVIRCQTCPASRFVRS